MKPIKVVYNWIGPKGPIWNTELPNILSFSSVAENSYVDSRHWWAEGTWTLFFNRFRPKFELHPSCLMEDDDVFIYPFSLAWRVAFTNYFMDGGGILEHGHVPHHIRHQVRNGKGYFLIDLSAEAFVQSDQLSSMHNYFSNYHKIPMNKIIYVTGCMNAEKIYDEFCRRYQLEHDRMNIFSLPVSQAAIANYLKDISVPPEVREPTFDENYLPQRLFLVWNRRFRQHRTMLALAMNKAGLVDRSFFGMNLTDPENPNSHFKNTINLYSNPELGITNVDVNNFLSKLPLVLDGEREIQKMCQDFDAAARKFYKDSLVSIVTETNFDLQELTLTEKSFKPIKEKHPFIIVGVPGALKALKEFGYKTFSEFWDENYDSIEDPRARMKMIIEITKYIGSWSNDKILEFKKQVKPIVEHNYQILKSDSSDVVVQKIIKLIDERFNS